MKPAIVIVALLLLSNISGCNQSPMTLRQAYIATLYSDSAELTASGEAWRQAMEPWFQGKEADIQAIESAHAHMEQTTESVRRKIANRTVPDDSKSRQFAELTLDYLDWQLETHKTYERWLDVVRSENPAKVATRQSVIEEMKSLNDQEMEWKRKLESLGEELGFRVEE